MKFHEPARMDKLIHEGQVRRLTLGEIALARTVFGSYIDYSRVWIHLGSYLPFGLQMESAAMTPSGELYFRGENYVDDFSTASNRHQHLFIHEMTHVWQYQNGMWVKLRGSMSWAVDYHYNFKGKSRLAEYSMEQQAAIIADYFYFSEFGKAEWQGNDNLYYNDEYIENIYSYYRLILTDFPNF